MSRPSREKNPDQDGAERTTHLARTTPIAVRVPATAAGAPDGTGSGSATGAWALVDGVPVRSAPGQEIQQAVLDHLHRMARAAGHPVHATVTDERSGYVVPLRVHCDGSSTFTAEPVRITAATSSGAVRPGAAQGGASTGAGSTGEGRMPAMPPAAPETPGATDPTVVLRVPPAPVTTGTAHAPGTVAPPTGEFGPPPVMDGPAAAADTRPAQAGPFAGPAVGPVARPAPTPSATGVSEVSETSEGAEDSETAPVTGPLASVGPLPDEEPKPHPDTAPAPVCGFDAVAEAVLGEDPGAVTGGAGPAAFAEAVTAVHAAVRDGRVQEAADLAGRTAADASAALGPDHAEVLYLRELLAYLAWLDGDPLRACTLLLDLARTRLQDGDARGAYGDVQSAVTAWRAVREPEQGLRLGGELLAVWGRLAGQDGPAADDQDRLDAVRARLERLAARTGARTSPADH